MRTIAIFTLFVLLSAATQPSSISKDEAIKLIRKINEQMYAEKHFGTDLRYAIYKNHSDSVAAESIPGFYYRNGMKEHSMVIGVETIQDENQRLVVDSNSQTMLIAEPKKLGGLIDESLIAALNYCSKIERQDEGNESELILHIQQGKGIGFSKIQVKFDKKTSWIRQLTLCYVNTLLPGYEKYNSPKVEIKYLSASDDRIKRNQFVFDKYLVRVNGQYQQAEAYKTYSLTNLKSK